MNIKKTIPLKEGQVYIRFQRNLKKPGFMVDQNGKGGVEIRPLAFWNAYKRLNKNDAELVPESDMKKKQGRPKQTKSD